MKNYFHLLSFALLSLTIACNDSNDKKDEPYAASTTDQAENANKENAAVDKATSDFMVEAAAGGMMEVMLGEQAQTNAQSQDVKNFGSMMVTDHTAANNELKQLASLRNVTLPAVVEGRHRDHVSDLGKKSGAEYDKAYINMMVDDHKKDIDMFEKAANNATDSAVKAFAQKTLPKLKMHHDAAVNLQKQLKQ